jgi:aminoglycoside phosphotransferase (APT) family kinase protein
MAAGKMHADELDIDEQLVRRLLRAQFPEWADLPLARVRSAGTDNAIFRLGPDMAVRLPRIGWAVGQVETEHRWLPKLAPHLPLATPTLLAMGESGEDYPWRWAVYRWLEGESTSTAPLADSCEAARQLAGFLLTLQRLDPSGGPLARRGVHPAVQDTETRAAIAELLNLGVFDAATARAATEGWEEALSVREWDREPVWVHGDMLPGNLLVRHGCLSAVIDFAGMGLGDPACDLMIAWGLFSGESREVFRRELEVDDATWARGRGWALSQALVFVPYYLETNPVGVQDAKTAISEILKEQVGH